jgi:hypothetical protein
MEGKVRTNVYIHVYMYLCTYVSTYINKYDWIDIMSGENVESN